MPMLLEKLWKARASLTHLGLDPAKLSDELLTDQVRALIRSDLQDWQLLLTGFVVSLESGDTGDLADLADDEVQELLQVHFEAVVPPLVAAPLAPGRNYQFQHPQQKAFYL